MQNIKKHKVIISVALLIIILAIYTLFEKNSRNKGNEQNTQINQTLSTTTSNGLGYTIEQIPITENKEVPKPIPDLNREVIIYPEALISPEAKSLSREKVKSLQAMLRKDPSYLAAWLDLGTYQKMGGDYLGSIISWQYASRLSKIDYVSLSNIANIYAYFLKDSINAEIYYKKAISLAPTQEYLYLQFVGFYRDVSKDIPQARKIVDDGLKNIPSSSNLLQLKESLK